MSKIIKLLVTIVILFQTIHTYAKPQQSFKNDTEVLGAAHYRLLVQEKLFTRTIGFCTKNHEELREVFSNFHEQWRNRNQKYLNLLDSIREDLYDAMKNEGQDGSIEGYESTVSELGVKSFSEAFEKKHNAKNAEDQFAYCKKIESIFLEGFFDITYDPQIKKFLDQRLLDDAAPNLSVEIELPIPNTETAKSIDAKIQASLESIGKYSMSSKQTYKDGASLSTIRVTFERHFPRKEGRPLVDQLFQALDKNLPANLVFRVKLKVGLGDEMKMRLATQN